MSLFTEVCILRTRGTQTGTDRYSVPIYGPPTDTPSFAWWEMTSEAENIAAAGQYISQYTLYLPLSASLQGWDVVVLDTIPDSDPPVAIPGAVEYRAVGRPGRQPSGFIVEGFHRVLLERVTG